MNPATPRSPHSGPSVAALVAAAVAGLAALILLALGSVLLYGEAKKDSDGYLDTGTHRLHTSAGAIATDDLDIDTVGSGWLLDTDSYGKVRLTVDSSHAKPVFAGIARSADVEDYLAGTDHTTLRDVDFSPFAAHYRRHPAARAPAAPAGEPIWAASAEGSGRQTLTWDVEHGSWSVVVMNADGSRGVDARVKAGAELPVLHTAGWGLTGAGTALLVGAAALTLLGIRLRRRAVHMV